MAVPSSKCNYIRWLRFSFFWENPISHLGMNSLVWKPFLLQMERTFLHHFSALCHTCSEFNIQAGLGKPSGTLTYFISSYLEPIVPSGVDEKPIYHFPQQLLLPQNGRRDLWIVRMATTRSKHWTYFFFTSNFPLWNFRQFDMISWSFCSNFGYDPFSMENVKVNWNFDHSDQRTTIF